MILFKFSQAKIPEWIAISFSRRSSWPRNQAHISCISFIGRQVLYQVSHQGSPKCLLLLLLSRVSRVWLCATPETAAHQAPLSLGFSRQEHWHGLPFPSPIQESEKWKWSRSVVFDPSWPHGLEPTRLLRPWDFPGKSTGVGCHCLLQKCLQFYIIIERRGLRYPAASNLSCVNLLPKVSASCKEQAPDEVSILQGHFKDVE